MMKWRCSTSTMPRAPQVRPCSTPRGPTSHRSASRVSPPPPATSLVASLQLVAAAALYAYLTNLTAGPLSVEHVSSVVSLSGGALFANIVSVVILIIETVALRR